MLTIRLNRVGKKNQAQFRIVLQEHTAAPGGRHIEVLGSYNPHSKELSFNEEKITYWISKGAQLSDTVHNMLVSRGVIKETKRKVRLPKKKKEENSETPAQEEKSEEAKTEASQAETKEEVKKEEVKEAPKAEEEKTEEKVETKAEESAPKKDEEEKKPEETR